MNGVSPSESVESPTRGRLLIVLAAVLWSMGGVFTKVLTKPTFLHLDTPELGPLQIACFRGLFAALVWLPTLRRRDLTFRPQLVGMMTCFALMNVTFVSAMALDTAANAILLQYTAPMWMFVASVWLLGEPLERRNLTALAIGLVGIVVILAGGWQEGKLPIVGLGLASGVTYAGVLLFLRVLRGSSANWLTFLNHLASGLVLLPFVVPRGLPSGEQLIVLFFYGSVQMGLPYWLMARGLRSVNSQEAGTITLLEPILNPVWVYLLMREEPATSTLIGGAFIVGALGWRYWPTRTKV